MDSFNLQPPFVGPGLPTYPHLLQLLRVTQTTVVGPAGVVQPAGSSVPGPTLYVAFVEQLQNGSLLPRDREPCLADDVTGLGIQPGYYFGRLANQFGGLPVYEVIGSPLVFNYTGVTFNFFVSMINYNQTMINVTNNSTVNIFSSTVNITNDVVNFINTTVNITNNTQVIFGTTPGGSLPPPGILSKPTQVGPGYPTWQPPANTYPLLWGAYDHIEWEWDNNIRGIPGRSSSTPGESGWVPFLSVGRTPVNDTNYMAVSTDRIISYIGISAPRVVTLPPASALPPGATLKILDESGQASTTKTITLAPASSGDDINNSGADVLVINMAYAGAEVETNGVSDWTVRQYGTSVEYNGTLVDVEPNINIINTCLTGVSVTVASNPSQKRVDITIKDPPMVTMTIVSTVMFAGCSLTGTNFTMCVPLSWVNNSCTAC